MPTVAINMPEMSGSTGMFLFLRSSAAGTLLNAGGDALTEEPASSGRFTATVAEAISELHHARVYESSSESAAAVLREGWIAAGETLVRDDVSPDVALTAIELWTKRNAVILTGLLTGAGTNTEVFVVSALGITATVTTDSSGNRSAVVWS